jgi:hypothetical protein
LEMGPVLEALGTLIEASKPEPVLPGRLSDSTRRPESAVRLTMPPPPSAQNGAATPQSAAARQRGKSSSPLVLAAMGAGIVAVVLYLVTMFGER